MPGRVAAEFGGTVVLVCRRHSRPCACLVARRRKRGHGEARPRGGEVNPSRQCPVSGGTGRKRGSARGQMQKISAGKFHGALWVAKAIPIPVAQEEAASSGFGPNLQFAAAQQHAGNGG